MVRVLVSHSKGFTLAEAVFSLGLSVVVILAAVALGLTALRGSQKGSDESAANGWTSSLMENFVYNLPQASDPFWSTSAYPSPYQTQKVQLGSTQFNGEIFVTDLTASVPGSKLVTVNVSWGTTVAGYGEKNTSLTRLIYGH